MWVEQGREVMGVGGIRNGVVGCCNDALRGVVQPRECAKGDIAFPVELSAPAWEWNQGWGVGTQGDLTAQAVADVSLPVCRDLMECGRAEMGETE